MLTLLQYIYEVSWCNKILSWHFGFEQNKLFDMNGIYNNINQLLLRLISDCIKFTSIDCNCIIMDTG